MSAWLIGAVFLISLVLTMVGLGGGLIFSPLFVLLGMVKSEAASASLFLNLIAAGSAALAYSRKKMVDYSLSVPLIIASSLFAPIGSYFNLRIDLKPFLIIMAVVLALAGARMLLPAPAAAEGSGLSPARKISGGIAIGACIGLMGGLLGIGGGIFVVPLLIYVLKTPTKIAAASSTFIVCFSSLTGFLGYA
ncbi:MAG: sulfite exporter TauE/SafE family protein, partial [Desulfobacterales bacterium]